MMTDVQEPLGSNLCHGCINKVAGFHGQLPVAKDCLEHVFPKTSAAGLFGEFQDRQTMMDQAFISYVLLL